jgi:hypothetical protein
MRYVDRHALSMLLSYVPLAEASPELRAARSSEVEKWLTVVYDRAPDEARKVFVELLGESSHQWPWSAVVPLQVDLAGLEDDVAGAIDRAPPALVLVLLEDTSEAEFLDPDNWIGDGEEWIPLRDALLSWSPETIESFMSKGIWSPPVNVDASEPQTDAGAGTGDMPAGGGSPPKEEPGSGGPSQPVPSPSPSQRPIWKSWQLWAAVGVTAVATYGLTRVRRG